MSPGIGGHGTFVKNHPFCKFVDNLTFTDFCLPRTLRHSCHWISASIQNDVYFLVEVFYLQNCFQMRHATNESLVQSIKLAVFCFSKVKPTECVSLPCVTKL